MSAHDAPTPGSAPATRSLAATTLLFASSLTVMAGALVAPALPRIAHQFAADPEVQLKSRLLLTVPALAVVVAGVLAGLLTDRLGRLKVLLGGLVIYAVGGASGLFLEGLDALLVGRFVLGVGVAAVMTAATTLIADLWPGPARTRFLGVQASFMGVGGIVFLVGGGALADLHWRAPFAIYLAALLLVPAAWLAFRGLKPLASSAEASLPAGQASAPVGVIWSAGALGFLLFYFIPTQVPFSLEQRLGAGGLEVGLVMGIANGVSAVASLLARRIIGRLGTLQDDGAHLRPGGGGLRPAHPGRWLGPGAAGQRGDRWRHRPADAQPHFVAGAGHAPSAAWSPAGGPDHGILWRHVPLALAGSARARGPGARAGPARPHGGLRPGHGPGAAGSGRCLVDSAPGVRPPLTFGDLSSI
jgi:MFS family permease